ncbi:MAG: hypothetical protein PHH52_01440 [Patescibacteria group bacterium]|nr:hypothetical protein [Patescibacteria group bacterium]
MKTKLAWRFCLLAIFAIFSVLFFVQKSDAQNQNDAIGIRIVPNPNHYSIYRWYQNQGFTGSPQALTVDGYEALRDGRTVYVNAAHIVPESKQIYTNIYLISYNQDSEDNTVDILGQIISHWKFNDNLPDTEATCSISALKCSSDSECFSGQTCSLDSGTCQLEEGKVCQVDADCPVNFFCDSPKAKIVRDLNRVGKMEELREALSKYRDNNNHYPLISSGSYLPGVSTSLWPSWQETFLSNLSSSSVFLDPINRFGVCSGYDNRTCWDKDAQKFIYSKEGLTLKLPNDSYAFVYTTNESGSDYNLCAVMESRDSSDPLLGYSLNPNDPAGSSCVTATGIMAGGSLISNQAPQISELVLSGISGQEFNGFIKATDRENDPLFWRLETGGNWSGWSAAPIIKGTNDLQQKKIFAEKAGGPGTYPITIVVTDSKGASTATTTSINIRQAGTLAEANEYIYRLDPTMPFNYGYYVSGSTSAPQNTVTLVSGPNVLNMSGIDKTSIAEGINRVKVSYRGIFSTNLTFKEDSESYYKLSASGANDAATENMFVIKIKVEKPILDFSCDTQIRQGQEYNCFIGQKSQGNYNISYSADTPLPDGLELVTVDNESGGQDVYLKGVANVINPGQEIRIKAVNDYGTENMKSFILRINSYCGDGIRQAPNTEGKGGVYNNGYEACDGSSFVASSVEMSDKTRQYACNNPDSGSTPTQISTYDYCIFKSPLDGGGFCGDTYCQTEINNIGGENKSNCPFDCDPNYLGPPPTLGGAGPDLGGFVPQCSLSSPCSSGFECINGFCEAKCWQVTETLRSITITEGDATRANVKYGYKPSTTKTIKHVTYNSTELSAWSKYQTSVKICDREQTQPFYQCNVVNISAPTCYDSNPFDINDCPIGWNSAMTKISNASTQCRTTGSYIAWDPWRKRQRAICYGNESVTRCFGDPCRTTLKSTSLDGRMDASGKCVKNGSMPSGGSSGGGGTIGGDIINDDYQNQDFIDQQKMIQE